MSINALRAPSVRARTRLPAALFALALLAIAGCDSTEAPPTEDCPAGEIGCVCDEGACAEGRCADGVCVACPEGTLRCPCGEGEACDDGLVCEVDQCVEPDCPPGELDCACDEDDACEAGLSCLDNTCVELPACPPGAEDCPCAAGAEGAACDDALVCLNGVCRDCPPDTAGCPCAAGAECEGGLVCDDGACRAARGCAEAGCGANQLCEEGAEGADARCLEDCAEGFVWDAEQADCVPAPPNCAADDPVSIAAECAAANRACLPDAAGASCGPCLAGFVEDGGACVVDRRATCADDPADPNGIGDDCAAERRACVEEADGARCGACLPEFVEDPATGQCRGADEFGECDTVADCPEGLVCSARQPAEDARCLPPACAPGETFDLRVGQCTGRCGCDGPGQTGQVWPVTDWNGDCVCETEPGFFFNTAAGSRRAEPCDGDGDGWTRRSAFVHIESPDEAVRLNARCDLRTIDRVTLVNEWGQQLELTVQTLSGGLAEFEPLYETDESDDEAEAAERQSEAYGARRFRAAELNPLTKACVTALDDFNDNGISDLREHHRANPDPQRVWMATFVAAGYFVELHTGHYEPAGPGQAHGGYVIAERSRCDAEFALGYDRGEGPYAQSCSRRRDGGYDPGEPIGYDFQRWSCAEPDGACPVLLPPVDAVSLDAVPDHGLCDPQPVEDPEPWRGMSHSSQFKCVEIIADQAPAASAFQRRRTEVHLDRGGQGRLNLNVCALAACPEDDPDGAAECAESDRDPAQANPAQARMRCEADLEATADDREALVGHVGFVALRYQDYGDTAEYAGGCINEQSEWPQLCPGFDPAVPGATVGEGNPANFGKIICGCGLNYGGPECDRGCADNDLHVGGLRVDTPGCVNGYCVTAPDEDGIDGGRSGVWMCGQFAATAYAESLPDVGAAFQAEGALAPGGPVGTITLRGQMPTFGTDGMPLCQDIDDEGRCSGITLR